MLVSCRQMQDAEARAFAAGISAEALMEQAGAGIARAIAQFHPHPGTAVLYLGKGNNAGDALVAGRHLRALGWRLLGRLSSPVDHLKPLPHQHLLALGNHLELRASPLTVADAPPGPLLLLDGLLGLGASGPLQPPLAALATEMNALRRQTHASVITMDLPSGLDGDSGQPHPDTVVADLTITIAQVKAGLVADSALNHVGRLACVRLPDLDLDASATSGDAGADLITPALLRPLLPRRAFDTHKGQAGRVLIVAGSPGLLGAAELASEGALRAGAGLVTLLALPETYPLLAARLPAEVMVKPVTTFLEALDLPHDALVIGPGLGREQDAAVRALLAATPAPAVVDADALNALAPLPASFTFPGPRLLTPHPGEWARLAPDLAASEGDRRAQAVAFAARHPQVTLLLKGARTLIAHAHEPTRINCTGHPGMATGGMGDVLSGVLGGLLGQGLSTPVAAATGAWLCGRAAEVAALTAHPQAILPRDVITHLGCAWRDLFENAY